MLDSKLRFSSRAENYAKYRPHYPQEILVPLERDCRLTRASVIADIGSGTGILTELFLGNGNTVWAVEPNPNMREAGERLLAYNPRFHSIDGTAEATTLADASVDFVTAGQAYHWFDRDKARQEFARILKPQCYVMLVWNERATGDCPFLADYEQVRRKYAIDDERIRQKRTNSKIVEDFFHPQAFRLETVDHSQKLDFEALKGRLLSSSTAPEAGHPLYEEMLAELARIFQAHQSHGKILYTHTTRMYYGQLS